MGLGSMAGVACWKQRQRKSSVSAFTEGFLFASASSTSSWSPPIVVCGGGGGGGGGVVLELNTLVHVHIMQR